MLSDRANAMGRRAYEWIAVHEPEFFVAGASLANAQQRTKCLAELALVVGTLTEALPQGRAILARAWAGLDDGAQLARLLPTWPVAATSYLPFRIAGCRSAELERRLAEGDWLRGHAAWPAFARFAIGVTLQSVGLALPWDEGEVILANRFFDPPAAETSPMRAVFLAHAMMWATDMGRASARAGAQATALYRAVAPAWHRALRQAGLLDPLGEIVIADACSGGASCEESLAMIGAAQRPDGGVPPRRGDASTLFDDLYHPTCVAALAGMLVGRSNAGTIATDDA